MAKYRGFSIVLHDVQKGTQAKADVQEFVQAMNWRQFVIAEEPYNHQDGSHMHIFLQLKCPRTFKSILSDYCNFWKSGRVQVDRMRGAMSDGCKYIMEGQSQKDKEFDPNPIIMLDVDTAQEAEVETQKVSKDDLHHFWCTVCPWGGMVGICPHWERMLQQYFLQNPPAPRMCIHKSEFEKCRHPDCVKYQK